MSHVRIHPVFLVELETFTSLVVHKVLYTCTDKITQSYMNGFIAGGLKRKVNAKGM